MGSTDMTLYDKCTEKIFRIIKYTYLSLCCVQLERENFHKYGLVMLEYSGNYSNSLLSINNMEMS